MSFVDHTSDGRLPAISEEVVDSMIDQLSGTYPDRFFVSDDVIKLMTMQNRGLTDVLDVMANRVGNRSGFNAKTEFYAGAAACWAVLHKQAEIDMLEAMTADSVSVPDGKGSFSFRNLIVGLKHAFVSRRSRTPRIYMAAESQ